MMKMFNSKKHKFIAMLVIASLLFSSYIVGDTKTATAATPRLTDPMFTKIAPQANALTTVDLQVQYTGGDSKDAVAAAKVLQGLVNRTSANKLYYYNDAIDALHEIGGKNWNVQQDWVTNTDELKNLPRTALSRVSGSDGGLHAVLNTYSSYVQGLIIWDPKTTNNVNVAAFGAAVTIAAQQNALAVSPALKDELVSWGFNFPILVDLRSNNFQNDYDVLNWSIDNYWATSNANMKAVFSLGSDSFYDINAFNEGVIDYAVAANGFAFNINMTNASDDTVLMKLMHKYPDGKTAIIGWIPTHPGGTGTGEAPSILNGSSYSVTGGNGLSNFSVYASFPDSNLNLPAPVASQVSNNDVYVGFMLTDGDALHAVYRGMFDAFTKDKTAAFGQYPITWSMAPQLANLAPPIYNYFVRNLPAGSDMTIGWSDKTNNTSDTGLVNLANSWKQYADLSDIHTIWTVHSQEDSQRADLVNWNQITVGYSNSQIAIHKANLNPDTVVVGTWNFGYNPAPQTAADGIRNVASQNANSPVFMMVTLGAPFGEAGGYYDLAKNIATNLLANPSGRNYKFVSARDMAATYKQYGGSGGSNGNLISNSDFELNPLNANNWNTQNWSSNANLTWATDYHHAGNYSAKVSGTSINAGFNKDYTNKISVAPNTTYTLSAWMKTDSVTGTGAWIWSEQLDSLGNAISGQRWDSPKKLGTNNWTQVQYTFTTASNATNINLYLHLNGSGTAWYDDLALATGTATPTPTPTPTPTATPTATPTPTPTPAPNAVSNNGFELNPLNANSWITNNWGGTPTFAWATDFKQSGTYSAKISGSSMVAANFTQTNIAIGGGLAKTFSGYLKTDAFTGTGVYYAIQEFNSSGVEIPGTYWESTYKTGTNGWTQVSRTWTTNANCTKIMIRAIANGTGTAWFDQLAL